MKRIFLRVAYDGSRYSGWQFQPNAVTIEGELNKAIRMLTGESVRVIGASRTDAGVHSLGNVAVFDSETRIPAEKIVYALNQYLPEDIVIQESKEVADSWHPRHCNSKKTYEYRILNRTFPNPTRRADTYHFYRRLNVEKMKKAASCFIGEHDFQSDVESTVRKIYTCEVEQEDDIIKIRICGAGFLYNMVRIIAGTLIQVGTGTIPSDAIPYILKRKNRSAAGPTAPANALTMIGIEYEEEPYKVGED